MKALAWGCAGLVGLGVLVVAVAEAAGGERKWAVCAGGAAGLLVALAGLLFAWKLSRLAPSPGRDTRFWKWWGGGLLVRLVLLVGFALALVRYFKPAAGAGLLTLAAVYLVGMFAEAVWVASVFFRAAQRSTPAGKPGSSEGH